MRRKDAKTNKRWWWRDANRCTRTYAHTHRHTYTHRHTRTIGDSGAEILVCSCNLEEDRHGFAEVKRWICSQHFNHRASKAPAWQVKGTKPQDQPSSPNTHKCTHTQTHTQTQTQTTPHLSSPHQMSERRPYGRDMTTSGAIQYGVPCIDRNPVIVRIEMSCRAAPKSASLTFPDESARTLAPLTSRCTMPRECRNARPCAVWQSQGGGKERERERGGRKSR